MLKVVVCHISTIFFDWILINEKITGFSFAFDSDTVFCHFLENENRNFLPLLKFLFENDHLIVTSQCKQSYRFCKSLKMKDLIFEKLRDK